MTPKTTILDNGERLISIDITLDESVRIILLRQRIQAETPEQTILRLIRQSECAVCGETVYRENQCESCRDYD